MPRGRTPSRLAFGTRPRLRSDRSGRGPLGTGRQTHNGLWPLASRVPPSSAAASNSIDWRRLWTTRAAAVPRVVLVGGEAGVGKTRLVRELERLAAAIDVRVLEGACLPLGGEGRPYGAMIEALRGLTEEIDPAELEALAGSGRAELARLMPELGSVGPRARAGSDGNGQSRLFEHLLGFLGRLRAHGRWRSCSRTCTGQTVPPSNCFGFLARNLRAVPVLIVATYRTDELQRRHPLPTLLAELDRSGRAERLALRRFDRQEMASQLEGILGTPPEPDLVAHIAARSEGNAFYAEELLAARSSEGELPGTLREALLARSRGSGSRRGSCCASVRPPGSGSARARLAVVAGLTEARVEGHLREALDNQILLVQTRSGRCGPGLSPCAAPGGRVRRIAAR